MKKQAVSASEPCQIIAVGKRRDGGTRFWCLGHGADATAKYGKRALNCRYAHIPRIKPSETLSLDLRRYPGGIGVWGAVPPVFDTTRLGLDRGIHVHAREDPRGTKEIDDTYRRVRITDGNIWVDINELDAIYFMVSMVFDKAVDEVVCTHCKSPHLDKDWFSVHPHRRHLCAACGKHFRDDKTAVGNPAARAATLGGKRPDPVQAKRTLNLRQKDFPGGIRVWGSNSAIVWTAKKPELAGIHIHAYETDTAMPAIDETFATVTVDDVALNASAVRTYMAQMAMPHLAAGVVRGLRSARFRPRRGGILSVCRTNLCQVRGPARGEVALQEGSCEPACRLAQDHGAACGTAAAEARPRSASRKSLRGHSEPSKLRYSRTAGRGSRKVILRCDRPCQGS